MKKRLQNTALPLMVLIFGAFFPVSGSAFDGTVNPRLFEPAPSEASIENNHTVITTFSKNYDLAFQKTLNDRHWFLALYYHDLSASTGLSSAMTEAERRAETRLVARQALSAAISHTVNDVNVLHTIKEYGRAMTSANLKVKDGSMDFEGPSLSKAGQRDEPSVHETLRSSLVLLNNADFGVSLRTTFWGTFQSSVTYFLAGSDSLGASLQKDLFDQSRVVLEYRMAP